MQDSISTKTTKNKDLIRPKEEDTQLPIYHIYSQKRSKLEAIDHKSITEKKRVLTKSMKKKQIQEKGILN
ncbi:hypothetical protein Sjap_011162 [Stephania japonica]|uniref:Uncharacterized protein n=1 Tax=Stephania japonica TaxID=461633 RepID=A0AAP0P759_9MAGN